MAIPSSGPISLDDIQTEFGGTNPISLSEYYAGGSLVASGTTGDSGPIPTSGEISIGEFYGSANRVTINLSNAGTASKQNIYTLASADPTYSAGITDVVYTNSGTLTSDSTGTAALQTGAFTSGDTVKIVNSGLIIGKGGNGGNGKNGPAPVTGNVGGGGGKALSLQFGVTIDNTGGTIAGGGGGGAGGSGRIFTVPGPNPKYPPITRIVGGSGGGGGAGTNVGSGGSRGTTLRSSDFWGIAGSNGTPTAGGAGGAANAYTPTPIKPIVRGANGGGRGQAGSNQVSPSPAAGGAAGQAITSNSNPITWIDMGTINGPTT